MIEIFKNVKEKLVSKYLKNSALKKSSKGIKKFKPRIKARLRKNRQILYDNHFQTAYSFFSRIRIVPHFFDFLAYFRLFSGGFAFRFYKPKASASILKMTGKSTFAPK